MVNLTLPPPILLGSTHSKSLPAIYVAFEHSYYTGPENKNCIKMISYNKEHAYKINKQFHKKTLTNIPTLNFVFIWFYTICIQDKYVIFWPIFPPTSLIPTFFQLLWGGGRMSNFPKTLEGGGMECSHPELCIHMILYNIHTR